MPASLKAEIYVPCPREGCEGEWRFEGLVHPPERNVGISSAYAEWERTGHAEGEHLPECMSMIRRDSVEELVTKAEYDAVENAISSYYEPPEPDFY